MKLLQIAFRRETAAPMLALVFASGISVALVMARMAWTAKVHYAFLIWNLFLAWVPLVFALLASDRFQAGTRPRWHLAALTGAWLLFFPNASYIFTDLIHLTSTSLYFFQFWVDLSLFLLCAFTGLVVGFISLYLMQSIAARMFGKLASWAFVAVVAGLSSVGVYIGRFLRFNSWDILRPHTLFQGIDRWMDGPAANATALGFLLLFATFVFLAYVMLYALTHLSPAPMTVADGESAETAI